jgi:hypothetical protein
MVEVDTGFRKGGWLPTGSRSARPGLVVAVGGRVHVGPAALCVSQAATYSRSPPEACLLPTFSPPACCE